MCRMNLFWKYIFVILFVIKMHASSNRNEDLVVETKLGSFRGVRAEDGNYTMFMGIPYATINESNIFGDALPQEPFDGVFEAYDDSSICPQVEEFNFTTVGSLDCLHMHVYVPDSASTQNPLPVMVYVYGGGFHIGFAGSFLYGPKYLVRHDVILVTFNYRLGPYGFLCHHTPEIPGNAGLKDQVLALRWVQSHIKSFGGDPDKVTVFGNSAGGMSIGLHIISETEILFSNIIIQSGSVYFPGLVSDFNTNSTLILAAALNFVTDDIDEAVSFLSTADVHSVIEATTSAGISFWLCVEQDIPGVERFLSNTPINANNSKARDIMAILGYNSEETVSLFPGNEGSIDWYQWELIFQNNLQISFDFEEDKIKELSSLVRRFYLGDATINNDVRQQLMDFMGDFVFVYSTIRSIKPYLEAGAEKIYQYLFSYEGERNFVRVKDNITVPGVAHADEIGYLFEMDFIPEIPTEEDQMIIDRMTTMWTNFAKYRDPTPETDTLLPVKWKAITKGSPYHYIDINTEMSAHMRYEPRRMSFWDLFYKAFEKYERGNIDFDAVPDSSAVVFLHPVLGFIVLIVNMLNKLYL